MKKKILFILSFVFALIFVLSLTDKPSADLPGALTAEAAVTAQGSCTDTITWTLDGSTLTFSGTGAMADYEDRNSVPWTQYRESITHIVIEDGITTVGKNAFFRCTAAVEVRLPGTLTAINDYAFSECSSIASIDLPEGLVSLGVSAFNGTVLKELVIPSTVEIINEQRVIFSLEKYTVSAENSYFSSENGILYNKNKSTLVAYPLGMTGSSFEIPSTVSTIGPHAFSYNKTLSSVTVGGSVRIIDKYAFVGSKIKTVTFENGLEEIRHSAFYACPNLEQVILPDSVILIEGNAFADCDSLGYIELPDSELVLKYGAIGGKKITSVFIPASVNAIEGNFVAYCNNLKELVVDENNAYYTVVDGVLYDKDIKTIIAYPRAAEVSEFNIPETVTDIGSYAFYGVSFLKKITVPAGVSAIGYAAFNEARSVESIELPSALTQIGANAFSHCNSLKSIVIPDGVTAINSQTFSYCTSLKHVILSESITFIDRIAFEYCSSLETVYVLNDGCIINPYKNTIPANTVIAGFDGSTAETYAADNGYSFRTIDDWGKETDTITWIFTDGILNICGTGEMPDYDSSNIISNILPWYKYSKDILVINVESGITYIGKHAFYSLSEAREVNLPDSVTAIGDAAFTMCSSLESIILPSEVTVLPSGCFYRCTSLKKVVLPEGLIEIGPSAFFSCTSLSEINIPETLTTILSAAFDECDSLTSFHINAGLTDIVNNVFDGCDKFTEITVSEENPKYSAADGILYNKAGDRLYIYPAGKPEKTLVIPENIVFIDVSAFEGAKYLENVYIYGNIKCIFAHTFSGAESLKYVHLPPSLTVIQACAFAYCTSLQTLTIPSGVEKIEWQAFLDSTALTEIVVPASVTYISESAFAGCTALESVTVLNPECTFESSYTGIPENTVIKGYKGSAAEAYAATYGLTFLPVTASGSFSDNCLWVLDENGLLEISGDGEMTGFTSLAAVPWKDYKADIKAVEIKKDVTSIGAYAFYQHTALDTVVLPEAVTHIDSFAFFDCTALKNINMSVCTALESIGSNVFNGCTALKSITLPESLSTIGENTFLRCMALEEIKVDENNDVYYSDGGVLFEKRGDEINLVCYPVSRPGAKYTVDGKVTGIAPAAFAYCDIIEEVKFPANSSLKYIGAAAFYECSALRSFTVPKNVERIDGNVFSMCFSLENIFASFSNKNYCAFDGVLFNADMTSVIAYPAGNERRVYVIPATVQIIEKESFSHCPNLEEILFEEGSELTVIKESAFYSSERLSLVSIPDGLKTIEDYAFMNCEALRYVYIPENTAAVGSYVFSGCVSLEAVVALSRECTFGQLADSGASAVYYAYENTAAAEQLEKQGQVVYIFEAPDGAFEYSDMILTIYDLSGVPVGDDPFRYPWARYSGATAVIMLKNTGNIGTGLFGGFTEVTVIIAENSDGVVIEKNAFTDCDSLKTVISFADITVESGAFGENDNISFFAQEGRDYQGEAEAARFSFSDGTVSFSGKALSLNSHDFLDLVTAVCYGYNDKEVRIIEFAALETVGFAFDSDFDDSNPELRVSYEDIKVVATVSYDGEVFEEISFNEFCSNAANDEWVLLRLSLYSDGDEPDEDTSIQVTFSEVMSYILHAIITFFNKILRLFRK